MNTPTIIRGNIDSLVAALPSLARKGAPAFAGDSTRFEQWARGCCCSTGERLAATFVLHVWNRYEDAKRRKPWRFDFGLAMNVWDGEHLAVFAAWVRDPWYA